MTRRTGAEKRRREINMVIKKKRVLIPLHNRFDFSSFEKLAIGLSLFFFFFFYCVLCFWCGWYGYVQGEGKWVKENGELAIFKLINGEEKTTERKRNGNYFVDSNFCLL